MTRVRRWMAIAFSAVAMVALVAVTAAPAGAGGPNQCRNQKGSQTNVLTINCNNVDISKNKGKVKVDVL